jgi:hypothetical protein
LLTNLVLYYVGLGLYSLAKRVDALQGQCGVMQRKDGVCGSIFWFEFPYRPDQVTASMNLVEEFSEKFTPPPNNISNKLNPNELSARTPPTGSSFIVEDQIVRLSVSSSLKTVQLDGKYSFIYQGAI